MALELVKKFRFESAHSLAKGYEGKCSNIHGHSWNGSLKIKCPNKLDSMGMGMDYSEIKNLINPYVDNLDHALLLYHKDPLIDILKDSGKKVVTFHDNPTSEVIALAMMHYAAVKIGEYNTENNTMFKVVEVVIEETCTTRCIVSQP